MTLILEVSRHGYLGLKYVQKRKSVEKSIEEYSTILSFAKFFN